jgi:hypothetical protein
MVRGTAGTDVQAREEEGRRGFSIGEWAGLAVMVVAAVAGYRQIRGGTGPAEKKVAEPAAQVEPALPAPPSARPPLAVGLTEAATPLPMASTAPRGFAGWDFQIQSPSPRTAPEATAPASPVSEVDVARQQGRQKLEAAIAHVAQIGRELVRTSQYYQRLCSGEVPATPALCEQLADRMGRLAVTAGIGLDDAEDAARTSWLPPGEVREIRKRYGLDDAGWDQIARLSRQFRR